MSRLFFEKNQISNININPHYSNNLKAEPSKNVIVEGPQVLPKIYVFTDEDANKRFETINKELGIKTKKDKNKAFTNFWKVFGGVTLAIFAALGIKKILK